MCSKAISPHVIQKKTLPDYVNFSFSPPGCHVFLCNPQHQDLPKILCEQYKKNITDGCSCVLSISKCDFCLMTWQTQNLHPLKFHHWLCMQSCHHFRFSLRMPLDSGELDWFIDYLLCWFHWRCHTAAFSLHSYSTTAFWFMQFAADQLNVSGNDRASFINSLSF